MGPLCRGGVLVPPHTKGALGIAAVPNQGRSLLPGRGSSALKPRGGIPSTGAWCYIQLGEQGLSPGRGQLRAGVPGGRRGSRLGLYLGSALPPGLPAPPGPRDTLPLQGPSVLKPCVTL